MGINSNGEQARHRLFLVPAVIAVLFAVTILCYWPSLGGPFIFDDAPNLQQLGNRGGLDSFDKLVEFVVTGQSGPLGRPLSLLSFALNGQDWPADPLPFRLTNLAIHLVNALLVFFLARSLLATLHNRETATRLGLLCMALWMLHPLLASTTAYVIQRMTQLSSLFVLTGLLCYIRGRTRLSENPRSGWLWILVGMGGSGALAVLSKETGALLPLYALVIEVTAFRAVTLTGRQRQILIALLCAPLLLISAYIALNWGALQNGFDIRSFTLSERLMTQAVVVIEYLRQVFAPELSGLGIIQDDFPVSKSLLEPVGTLVSLLLIAALLAFATLCRKRLPIVSLGIFWFFAGHALEAGPLPLELYFDHRNYLPLFGPLIAVCSLLPALPQRLRRAAPVVFALFLGFLGFLTWQSAKLWGNEDLMMQVALIDHPKSLRARQDVVNRLILDGDYAPALDAQLSIAQDFPEHTATRLSILNLRCIKNSLTEEQVLATRSLLARTLPDTQAIGFFRPLLTNAERGTCAAFALGDYQSILDALLENPLTRRISKMRGAAHYFKALAYKSAGQLNEAIEQLNFAYEAVPEMDVRLQQAVWMLESGRPDEAQHYLELAKQHRNHRFWTRNLRQTDLQNLQQQIKLAKRRTGNADTAD